MVSLLAVACASQPPLPAPPIARPSVTDDLVALVPLGADAVLEVDVRRLRDNDVVGPALRSLAGRSRALALLGFQPLVDLDHAAIALYATGTPEPQVLALLRGDVGTVDRLLRRDDTAGLARGVVAIGPDELLAAARSLHGGEGGSMLADARFVRLRDAPVPSRAPGAALRFTAALGLEARVSLAGRLGVDEVPATLSVWLDVVDDLALVALLGGGGEGADALMAWVADRSRRDADMRALFGRARASRHGNIVRVVSVVTPKRLARWAGQETP